eukprot:15479778-Alexandrium_andersonii.AAC.1
MSFDENGVLLRIKPGAMGKPGRSPINNVLSIRNNGDGPLKQGGEEGRGGLRAPRGHGRTTQGYATSVQVRPPGAKIEGATLAVAMDLRSYLIRQNGSTTADCQLRRMRHVHGPIGEHNLPRPGQ